MDVVESLVGLGYFCGWGPVNVVGLRVRTYHARIVLCRTYIGRG